MNLYDFKVKDNTNKEKPLSDYKDKVLLIVNTATHCGLTPQYEGLEKLQKQFENQGFEILDFPCNQFLEQASGTDEEIDQFCKANYSTTFHRFSKLDVNGENAHPLFVFLKSQIKDDIGDEGQKAFEEKVKDLHPYKEEGSIKWNFGKFLIDKQGNVVKRYSPSYPPEKIAEDIKKYL